MITSELPFVISPVTASRQASVTKRKLYCSSTIMKQASCQQLTRTHPRVVMVLVCSSNSTSTSNPLNRKPNNYTQILSKPARKACHHKLLWFGPQIRQLSCTINLNHSAMTSFSTSILSLRIKTQKLRRKLKICFTYVKLSS